MTGSTIAEALRDARARLAPVSDTALLDAELLLGHVLSRPRAWLHTWPEYTLEQSDLSRFRALIEQRATGAPVAYLTGRCRFWSLTLEVNPATLVPRPETELLVELALARIPPDTPLRIADLGTGSGAIAIAIAKERPDCRVIAVDCSREALAVARRNAATNGVSNLLFHLGNWYRPLGKERFDLILSNPPYIAEDDPHLRRGGLRFEPRDALVAGADGLDALRTLIRDGRTHLRPGGWLLLEHGFDQGDAVMELLRRNGYHECSCHPDLAGHPRVSIGRQAV